MKWIRDPELLPIAQKVFAGERLTFEEGLVLYHTPDLNTLARLANAVRNRMHGDKTYFVHSLRLSQTNICYVGCTFCGFAARKEEERAWDFDIDDVVKFVQDRHQEGLSEIHISSGHHPTKPFSYYLDMMRALKRNFPQAQVKAWTAAEITHFSKIARLPVREVLSQLKEAGLDALPGGGAEIFAERVRHQIAKNKVKAEGWLEVHRTAHELGLRTNATMLYGHIETLAERLDHMHRLRELQDQTGGFYSFIPLAFQPMNNNLAMNLGKTDYTTGLDDLRNLAVARIYLDNFAHIKGYWVQISPELTQVSLDWGVSDIDGTIIDERISHASGATSEAGMSKYALVDIIRRAGRTAVLRDALYHELEVFA